MTFFKDIWTHQIKNLKSFSPSNFYPNFNKIRKLKKHFSSVLTLFGVPYVSLVLICIAPLFVTNEFVILQCFIVCKIAIGLFLLLFYTFCV